MEVLFNVLSNVIKDNCRRLSLLPTLVFCVERKHELETERVNLENPMPTSSLFVDICDCPQDYLWMSPRSNVIIFDRSSG